METLEQFLARMTLVWEARQIRLQALPAASAEATARYNKKHPDRVKASQAAAKERQRAKKRAAAAEKAVRVAEVRARGREALRGGGAERREGGGAHLSDQEYAETTWRAPWAAPYALSRR